FRAIVEQHGGMVLAVCRRGVRSEADADDLFQATFLQLARSANRIQQPEALAAWLHGTARRLTLQWQKQQYRSLPPATSSASSDPLAEASWQEVRQLLDDELARLPLRLRSPLVLCYLEGLKGSEAAEQLGISLRTLRRDLDAGRVLLRERLAARGLKQLTLVAVLTASSGLLALPPPQLLNATLSQWAVWQAGQPLTSSVQSLLASSMPTLVPSMMSMILLTGITAFLFLATNPVSSPILPATPGRPVSVQVARQRVDSQGDPLPDGVLARLGSIRFRHGSAVYAMAFSKNDQRLYTGSNDGTLRCSSYPSGQVLWSVTMPNVAKNGFEAVVALAVSADDTLLAVSAMNDTTVVYDAHTGKELKRRGNDRDRSSWLAFSSDGKSLFAMTTTQATSMREYDLATGETISKKELSDCYDEAATTRNIHFAVDRNQARVVLADVKNLLVVYNLKTQQVERRLAQHPKPVVAVVWSEDGSAWLSLDSNKTLRRWDAKTGELQWSQTINAVQGNGMLALAGRGESARVILASDREIQFFNPHTGALQQTIPRRLMNYSLAFSHDSKV
ncbi:MAG TPA: sigma-70 family RNA polymerase sigma factor, partial [Gemmatales bacterium]|nr:sigma-70 family RNA polymerase sigma factor [Gemmatales bacterium]